MTGRLYERDGKYTVILEYKDKEGKKKQKWIKTGLEIKGNKKKAEAKIDEFIKEYSYLEYNELESKKQLFTEAVKEWLKSRINKIERSTYEGYQNYIDCHIIPYFEPLNLTIDEVTPKHIKDYYEYKFNGGRCDKKDGGLHVQSIKKHSVILNQVLTEAVITECIPRNPVNDVPFPRNEKPKFISVFLNDEEANNLLQAFNGHELQPLIYVTLYYGLRRGEVLGLRWQAVDFERNTIRIEHTVVKNLTIEYKDKTKNITSMHTFPLLADVKKLLLKLKELEEKSRRIFGNEYKNSDYIFKWQDGTLYRPDYVTHAFQKVLKNKDLPPMRFHDLRHSTASILHDKGWDLKDIQEWLRHADIETTGNIYTHISEQRKQVSADSLEKTFKI